MSFILQPSSLYQGLLGDAEMEALFGEAADLEAMLAFEAALATAEAAEGVISNEAKEAITVAISTFQVDQDGLRAATEVDGMCVPGLIRQLKAHVSETHRDAVHFGSTSQDVIDTSLILRLQKANGLLRARIEQLDRLLAELDKKYGQRPLMGRTRMQAALPVTVGHRIGQWLEPLRANLERLARLENDLYHLQFAGPVGTLDKLGDKADAVRTHLAIALGLKSSGKPWHTDRARLAEYANWLSLVTGNLGKMGQDIALMAQQTPAEIALKGGGTSSAMPHKQNPVRAEVLVSQARFNAQALSGMHQALVHEQERSGACWTLEWLLLPQMCVTAGSALNNAITLTQAITSLGSEA